MWEMTGNKVERDGEWHATKVTHSQLTLFWLPTLDSWGRHTIQYIIFVLTVSACASNNNSVLPIMLNVYYL